MARISEAQATDPQPPEIERQLQVALDNMPGALTYVDESLNIVFCNDRFRDMYTVPPELLRRGRPYADLLRYLAVNGYFGAGDIDDLVARRVESLRHPSGKSFEDPTPDGQWYRVLRRRVAGGGTVTVITDITQQKLAEQKLAAKETELQVALDNMPGALTYVDENLNIVFCNDRFRDMYTVPLELLRRGRPYADLLRYLAVNGYYGAGDVGDLVARRVESLRHPSGKSFEDHTPDGHWYRVLRRRVAGGGTVTVITDITEQKLAEQELAAKETELQVALDNMPGALTYVDENQNIVFCNDRFRGMYTVPPELLRRGRPYADLLRYLAVNGYFGAGNIDDMVARRVESLRHPSGKSFEDPTPDGHWYHVLRRRVVGGGTVTVVTDITEQKLAEQNLIETTRRTEEANKLIAEKNRTLKALYKNMRQELSLARTIQRTMLPDALPSVAGLELGLLFIPSGDIGGDFVDFIRSDNNERLGVVFADITGHGVPAALLSAMFKVLINDILRCKKTPAECISLLNRRLCREFPQGNFASTFYSVFDTATRTMTYVKASQEPALLFRSGKDVTVLAAGGPVLGIINPDLCTEVAYREHTMRLEHGDTVFFYTDGLLELENSRGEMLESSELIRWITEEIELPPQALVERIYARSVQFAQTSTLPDDVAALAVRVTRS